MLVRMENAERAKELMAEIERLQKREAALLKELRKIMYKTESGR